MKKRIVLRKKSLFNTIMVKLKIKMIRHLRRKWIIQNPDKPLPDWLIPKNNVYVGVSYNDWLKEPHTKVLLAAHGAYKGMKKK